MLGGGWIDLIRSGRCLRAGTSAKAIAAAAAAAAKTQAAGSAAAVAHHARSAGLIIAAHVRCSFPTTLIGNQKCALTFFTHKLFEHGQGSGTSGKKFPRHPRFLSSKPKEDKLSREGANFSATTPSCGRPPPKKLIFVLFFLA